jgi:hypothetical protein
MKLGILYTAHRQLDELDFAGRFLESAPVLKQSQIIFHCNNSAISSENIAQKLAAWPVASVQLIHSTIANRGGYAYGQWEAILDSWEALQDKHLDWVIHLHPDVFLANEQPLIAAIESVHAAGMELLVSRTFGTKTPAFATDFFAFRPSKIPRDLFASFEPLIGAPAVVPLEHLFFNEVHRHKIRYSMVQRFHDDHYHRDIDLLGLWHEHDLRRVKIYFKHPCLRWIYTAATPFKKPYPTARLLLHQWTRRITNLPCERLVKKLTSV